MSLKKCVAQFIKGYIRRLQTLAPSQWCHKDLIAMYSVLQQQLTIAASWLHINSGSFIAFISRKEKRKKKKSLEIASVSGLYLTSKQVSGLYLTSKRDRHKMCNSSGLA